MDGNSGYFELNISDHVLSKCGEFVIEVPLGVVQGIRELVEYAIDLGTVLGVIMFSLVTYLFDEVLRSFDFADLIYDFG